MYSLIKTNLGNLDKWKSRQSLRVSIVVKIKEEFELLYRECLQCTVNGYQKVLKEQNCIKLYKIRRKNNEVNNMKK